jgi:hypothetical protein
MRSIGLMSCVFCVLLVLSGITRAADPAPAAPAAAATPGDTPPTDAAAAADTPPATTSPASTSIDQAMPAAPEPLLLARLEAKTLAPDFIKLGDDAEPFLARYRAATKPPAKGAVLFIPAPGQFIGEDAVISAALTELPAGGWTVLAVQTPLLPSVASMQEYADSHDQALARAKQALVYLTAQQTPATAVVGRAASIELAREVATDAGGVTALVALGPWRGQIGEGKLPLFDVSPDRDRAGLAHTRERYEEAGRMKLPIYKQVVLSGADQRFVGFESEIVRRIRGFAEHLPGLAKAEPAPGS